MTSSRSHSSDECTNQERNEKELDTSLAELARPHLGKIVNRHRLYMQLEASPGHLVVWVQCPPGSGKTVLAASYLSARRIRAVWYRVDPGDNDVASFFHFMSLAVRQRFPRRKKAQPAYVPHASVDLAAYSCHFFRRLLRRWKRPFLVLDDYQQTAVDAQIHGVVVQAITQLPPGGRLVILSRSEPPPAFARLFANGQLALISWPDLRLSPRETYELVRLGRAGEVDQSAITRIHSQTDGWAAGVVLLSSLPSSGHEFPDRGASQTRLFDYFASEVLDQAEAESQSLLLETSVFSRFTAEMAAQLCGRKGTLQRLEALAGAHCFISRHVGDPPVFCYHPLFLAFLRSRAWDLWPKDQRIRLIKRAACLASVQGEPMGRLSTVVYCADIKNDDVHQLIRQCHFTPPAGSEASEAMDSWPWPVQVFTLGRFNLLRDGATVRFSRKVQAKPLELIQALVAHGGTGVSEDVLADALWPESDGAAARQAFAVTLHRLRRLLGSDKTVERQGGSVSLATHLCWVDIWAFEHLIQRTTAQNALDHEELEGIARRLLALYRGPFLGTHEPPFGVIAARERLRSRFVRAVKTLGEGLEKASRFSAAVELYEQGLEAEEHCEEIYRRLMQLHARQGEHSAALAVYQRCRRVLASTLEVSPSPATEAARRAIQNRLANG